VKTKDALVSDSCDFVRQVIEELEKTGRIITQAMFSGAVGDASNSSTVDGKS
jgi:hypothetical protein